MDEMRVHGRRNRLLWIEQSHVYLMPSVQRASYSKRASKRVFSLDCMHAGSSEAYACPIPSTPCIRFMLGIPSTRDLFILSLSISMRGKMGTPQKVKGTSRLSLHFGRLKKDWES
jgi:hypothetical protein